MVQFFSDNFTAANGTAISARNSDSGHAWAFNSTSGGGNVLIQSNRAYPNAAASLMYANTPPGSVEYDVTCGFHYIDSTSQFGFGGRQVTTAATMYYVMHTAGQFNLIKLVDGTPTNIGAVNYALSANTTTDVKLAITNATKKVFVAGVEIISSSDNAITGTGRVGIRAPAAGSTTTGKHFNYITATDQLPDVTYHSYSDADTISSVDTLSRAAFATFTDSDTITRVESYAAAAFPSLTDADTITRTELAAIVINIDRTDTDTISESSTASLFGVATRTDTDTITITEGISMVSNFPPVINELYSFQILLRSQLIHKHATRLVRNPVVVYYHQGIFQGGIEGGATLGSFILGTSVLATAAGGIDDITYFVVLDEYQHPRYVGEAASDWNLSQVTITMSRNVQDFIPQLVQLGVPLNGRG